MLRNNEDIWIIIASRQELGGFWETLSETLQTGDINIKTEKQQRRNLIVAESGMGGKNALKCLQFLFQNLSKPALIINVGTAGSLNENISRGDWLIPNAIILEVAKGKMATDIILWPKYLDYFTQVFHKVAGDFRQGILLTVGKPKLTSKEKLKIEGMRQSIAIDMEAYFLAQITGFYCLPFLVVKRISDEIDEEAKKGYKKYLSEYSSNTGNILTKVIEKISS